MTANTIAGLAELFLTGFIAGSCIQIPLLRKKTARVSLDQLRARRLYMLDGWLVVIVLGLVSWLRLAEVLGTDTSILSRFLYVAILMGSLRLVLTMRDSLSRVQWVGVWLSVFIASLGMVLPLEGIMGTGARISPAGLVEPVRGAGFFWLMLAGLPLPVYGLRLCLGRRQYGSGFVFCSGMVSAVLAAILDLWCTPEILAAAWVSLIGSRIFPVQQAPARSSQSAEGKRSRIQKRI